VACQCQLFTIMRHSAHGSRSGSAPADHESYAFVVSTSISTKSMVDKLAKLESHLRQIGSEVQASDVEPSAGPTVDRGLASALDALELTARQRDIVERLARGQRVPSIAAALYISRSTVRNHLAQVYRLLGVHSQEELLTVLQAP
jgi:DNA-binding NarL/FixJ family response regulator